MEVVEDPAARPDADEKKEETGHHIIKEGRRLRARYGPYKVLAVLGEGGMGAIVLRAEDTRTSEEVALKVFSPDRRMTYEMRRRFLRGAQASAGIVHPNVVQILDTGEEKGRPYFSMELVRGSALDEVLAEEGRLPPHRALDLILQAARGLQAAAQKGVIHRDVKPQNLLTSEEGQVKVSDFGIASIEQQESIFLQPGVIVGTPDYMSPEMCNGKAVDHRSDIYSLGITLYELLAGRPPFHGTPVDIMYKQSHKRPRAITRRVPTLHPGVARIVSRMLSKKQTGRYQTYEDLILDLEEVVKKGNFSVRSRRRPVGVYTISLGITLGLVGGLWIMENWFHLFGEEPAPRSPPPAEVPAEVRLPLENGGFEADQEADQELIGWRIIPTGPLAETPEELVVMTLDQEDPHQGRNALRLELVSALPATPELEYATPWGLTCMVEDVEALESRPVELRFWLKAQGEDPRLIVRLLEDPPRDTPWPAHPCTPAETWIQHSISFTVEPSSGDRHRLEVRLYLAGAPGDTFLLDDVTLVTR